MKDSTFKKRLFNNCVKSLTKRSARAAEERRVSALQAANGAMDAIADLSRRYIDSHTDVPNWVIHDFVAWCRQQHQ